MISWCLNKTTGACWGYPTPGLYLCTAIRHAYDYVYVCTWRSCKPLTQNTVTACADQVGMLQYKQRDSVWGQSSMDQCNEILQIAEQFQDVHLLALAANTKAALMKRKG